MYSESNYWKQRCPFTFLFHSAYFRNSLKESVGMQYKISHRDCLKEQKQTKFKGGRRKAMYSEWNSWKQWFPLTFLIYSTYFRNSLRESVGIQYKGSHRDCRKEKSTNFKGDRRKAMYSESKIWKQWFPLTFFVLFCVL